MKRIIAFSLWLIILTVSFYIPGFASSEIDIYLDGKQTALNPRLIDSVTYVPVSKFANLLDSGITTAFSHENQILAVTTDNVVLEVSINDVYITANERCIYLDASPQMINGYLYVPIRVLAHIYGVEVSWDAKTHSIYLYTTGQYIQSGNAFYDSDDLYWLARIISAESKGEPLSGQIAVGNVILNRVEAEAYPHTIYDVIFDKKHGVQFSPASNNTIYQTPTKESVAAAKICLEGYSLSDTALYFLNSKIAKSNWIVKNRGYVMTIGNHSFYS